MPVFRWRAALVTLMLGLALLTLTVTGLTVAFHYDPKTSRVGTNIHVANDQPVTVDIHTIVHSSIGYTTEKTNLVVNDQAQFRILWMKIFCNTLFPCPSVPNIDLTKRTVLAAFQGEEPNSGYDIEITQVESTGSSLVVTVVLTVPGPTCTTLQVITSPMHIVDIPKTNSQVSFATQTHITDCGPINPPPDLTIMANPTAIDIQNGTSDASVITVTSRNLFVRADISYFVKPSSGLLASITPSNLTYASGVAVVTFTGNHPGEYSVNITVTAGSLTRWTIITVKVDGQTVPDYSEGVSPDLLVLRTGENGTSILTLVSRNGFTGTVYAAVSFYDNNCDWRPPCFSTEPQVFLSAQSANLASNGRTTITLTVSAPLDFCCLFGGFFLIVVHTYSSERIHDLAVGITVLADPLCDACPRLGPFSLSTNSTNITTTIDNSASINIAVLTNPHILSYPVTLTVISPPKVSCNLSNTSLSKSGTVNLTCTSHSPGSYFISVIGTHPSLTGPRVLGISMNVTTLFPADLQPPSTPTKIMGLEPLQFYGLLGGLIVAGLAAGIGLYHRRGSSLKGS